MADKIVLVDLDGVAANFEKRVLETFRNRYPERPFIPLEERMTFDIEDQYPEEDKHKIKEIYWERGFFLNLEPIEGSVDALKYLRNRADLFICTAPLSVYENCVLEKYQWVEKHHGKDMVKRVVMTKDKTLVRGNVLIDDRPELRGSMIPTWEHVLYEWPYNAHINGRRRLNWRNYREVLEL